MSDTKRNPDWLAYTKNAAPVIGIFMAGFALAAFFLNRELNSTKENLVRVESELSLMRTEVARQKVFEGREVAVPVNANANSTNSAPLVSPTSTVAASSQPASASPSTSASNSLDLKLYSGASSEAFEGNVRISLIATEFHLTPTRYSVFADVSTPNQRVVIKDKDVGETAIVTANKKKYEVRIIGSGSSSATFRITEML